MSVSSSAKGLEVGDNAPVLSGTTDTGATLNLGDVYQKNKYTLVFFFPKAGTSGCTAQGCSLRDAYDALSKQGVAILGASTDSVEKQAEFKKENHFPFTLLADPDKKIIDAFGVGTMKVPLMGEMAHRQAYLVKDGKVIYADHKGSTTKQADDILAVIAQK